MSPDIGKRGSYGMYNTLYSHIYHPRTVVKQFTQLYVYIYIHIIPTITTQPLHNNPFAASGNFRPRVWLVRSKTLRKQAIQAPMHIVTVALGKRHRIFLGRSKWKVRFCEGVKRSNQGKQQHIKCDSNEGYTHRVTKTLERLLNVNSLPIGSMYGIYIYTIHGSQGLASAKLGYSSANRSILNS